MARFKEQKKSIIEKNQKEMKEATAYGERLAGELQSVKSQIDSICDSTRDEDIKEQVKVLEQQYRDAGREAHRENVEAPVEAAREDMERNKSDIADERSRTENSIRRIGEMRGITEVGRNEARAAEGNLQRSADEFKNMESTSDNIVSEQQSRTQNTRSRIQSIFG